MSDQVDLQTLNTAIQALQKVVEKLDRSVSGDPDNNMPSMRRAMQDAITDVQKQIGDLKSELKSVDTAASDRLDVIEQTNALQAARQEGIMTVIKWAGGTSLLTMIGVIVALIKLLGGGS